MLLAVLFESYQWGRVLKVPESSLIFKDPSTFRKQQACIDIGCFKRVVCAFVQFPDCNTSLLGQALCSSSVEEACLHIPKSRFAMGNSPDILRNVSRLVCFSLKERMVQAQPRSLETKCSTWHRLPVKPFPVLLPQLCKMKNLCLPYRRTWDVVNKMKTSFEPLKRETFSPHFFSPHVFRGGKYGLQSAVLSNSSWLIFGREADSLPTDLWTSSIPFYFSRGGWINQNLFLRSS